MKYSNLTNDVQNKLFEEFLGQYNKKNPLFSIVYPIILVCILILAILGVIVSHGFIKVAVIIFGIALDSFICFIIVDKYKLYKKELEIDYKKWLKVRNINK